jgi:ribonuclease BN (tRNA processing enzyme)
MARPPRPFTLRIRTYQVGFGDCFLLSFRYPRPEEDRHVLIDFGTTSLPKNAPRNQMVRIAQNIRDECGGQLHAVVATHRHKDHISGFARTRSSQSSGAIIASLKPEIVIQPWTEDPDARPDARKPTHRLDGNQAFVRSLSSMQAFSASMLIEIQRLRGAVGVRLFERLAFLGDDNLSNRSAIDNLMTMAPKEQHRYVYFGSRSGLEEILPGVETMVLGPPTLEQSEQIRKERAKDSAEFWHFQAQAGRRFSGAARPIFPGAPAYAAGHPPAFARWFTPRMDSARGDQLLELVRILDEAMNNTSVILLFEAGDKRFLFPGDAQIENWSYALKAAEKDRHLRAKLQSVNYYKVGHHGSLNATPKSLWELFKHKSAEENDPDRLHTVVSTMSGKHGSSDRGTEVPRKSLMEALEAESQFFSTQSLTRQRDFFHDEEFVL